jgi:hypothetical protein
MLLTSCQDEEKLERLQEEIKQMGEVQRETDSQINQFKSQIDTLNADRKRIEDENSKLKEALESVRKEAGQLQKDFNSYREKYKLGMRARTQGMNLGTVTVKGTQYYDVVGKESNDEIISVMHSSGFIKFAWKDMPDEIRRHFGIENPGDYAQRNFGSAPISVEPKTFEERVALHDKLMLETQTKIQNLKEEHSSAMEVHAQLVNKIGRAKLNNEDNVELNRSKNINDAKLTNLKTQILNLSRAQSELMARDPRKKKA